MSETFAPNCAPAVHRQRGLVCILCLMLAIACVPATGFADDDEDDNDIGLSVTYLGVANVIRESDRFETTPRRNQFDFAANVDFSMPLGENIEAVVQLQGGTGKGSLGLAGPDAAVTDVNVTFALPQYNLAVTVGSFDTPFGDRTKYITNNAASFGNRLLLNSLFYSALAGSPMTTLNALGVKGAYATDAVDFTAALTNGTDATAANPDGNFEVIVGAGWRPVADDRMRLGGAFMVSDDVSLSGESGLAADLTAWMTEARFDFPVGLLLDAYYGQLTFGDDDAATEDGVQIWMGELCYEIERWHVVARVSGWKPDDHNGNGSGISAAVPNPGLARPILDFPVRPDQRLTRFQIGVGVFVTDNVQLKGEFVSDDYRYKVDNLSSDVQGVIIGLNGSI